MSKIDLNEFKNQIKSKYGYSEDFAQTIATMAEALAEYLGEDYQDIIYNAVSSCKYTIAGRKKNSKIYETIHDVMVRENMIRQSDCETIISSKINPKYSNGIFVSKAKVTSNDTGYQIDGIERLIALPYYFNPDNPAMLAILIEESLHLIKSYLKGHTIQGDTLVSQIGLRTKTEKIAKKDNGEVTINTVSELGLGFEEAINGYDALCLMREHFYSDYDTQNYFAGRIVAGFISDNIGLKSQLRDASMTKNSNELREIFDIHMEQGYDEFLRKMDKLKELDSKRFQAYDVDTVRTSAEEFLNYYENSIAPLVGKMQVSIRRDELEESLSHEKTA